MPHTCVVPRCLSNGKSGAKQDIRFHRFPKDVHQRIIWANEIKKPNWLPTENSRICEVNRSLGLQKPSCFSKSNYINNYDFFFNFSETF